MVENWLLELLWAIGRFFIHPLFYLFFLISFMYGMLRIKRERSSFHIRVQDIYDEMKFTYTKGLLIGLFVSIAIFALGLSLPFGTVVILAIITAVLSFTLQLRWLSAAFTIGLTLLAVAFMPDRLESFFVGFSGTSLASLSILAGILLVAEGILVMRTAHQNTSPCLKTSTRGLPIGIHQANRTWMLPLLMLVPGGDLTSSLTWWPVLSINGEPFLLLVIPFFLGFSQRVQGSLPKESINTTGQRVMWLGVMTLVLAAGSIWWTPLAFIAVGTAMVGREFITIRQRMNDASAAFYFSKRDHGLMILGILPQSPAEKMNLRVGEIIMKVNGYSVHTVDEFYQALQKNRAFCKLEVIGFNGEIRFDQRALYDGEHHELGILFVQDHKKWEDEAV
ncbi:PDZ domain-containing protein [Metabacillus halosaccharovorans]|uniref:PDZ domain-containing protein n=1 Tax=Metabacillus halosaccharovorans TaxID=930124 RepID=A0ABT3DBX3_9BACI|nr:PDZ domain-containing protein [Metabacillus halosaccharovorans]MCV9884447.1 PDZ domain-containing protein [Metabacillus halosaccharovorans]